MAKGTDNNNSEILSIVGVQIPFYVPAYLEVKDPREIGRGLLSLRFELRNDLIDTLDLLVKGHTIEKVAEKMGKDEKTIKNRIQKIIDLTKTKNRTQAVALGVKYGLG